MIGHGHCTEDKWDKHAKNMTRTRKNRVHHGCSRKYRAEQEDPEFCHVIQGWLLPFFLFAFTVLLAHRPG